MFPLIDKSSTIYGAGIALDLGGYNWIKAMKYCKETVFEWFFNLYRGWAGGFEGARFGVNTNIDCHYAASAWIVLLEDEIVSKLVCVAAQLDFL